MNKRDKKIEEKVVPKINPPKTNVKASAAEVAKKKAK
jgi:hypothetical protein